jgi:hypothetical protein
MPSLSLIVIIAVMVFGVLVALSNQRLIRQWYRCKSWKATTARIVDDRDESVWAYRSAYPARQARMERVHAKIYFYRYEVDGHVYCTNQLGFGDEFVTYEHFRIGEKVTAYYDPQDPQNAVLRRGFPDAALIGLVSIGVAGLSLLLRVAMS